MPFPEACKTVAQKIEYLSTELMPKKRFDEYVRLMDTILDDRVHYIDPVHEFTKKGDVLRMLAKYVPRAANEDFRFNILVDGDTKVIWRWTLTLKIRFTWFKFVINGLVHAEVNDGKIIYQREYYDPMESIGVIPIVGRLYKLMLLMG